MTSCGRNSCRIGQRNFVMDSRRPWRVTVPPGRRYKAPNPLFEGNNPLYIIIGTNCCVWGTWQMANDRRSLKFMHQHFTISPFGIFKQWRFHTAITSFFSHIDGWHLFSNMFTLFFFGREALMMLGGYRFAALYFGGGCVSSACFALWPYLVPRSWPAGWQFGGRSSQFASGLGASGAVSAVVTWSILTFPTRLVYLYALIPVPAFVFGAGYLLNESYGLYTGRPDVSNVAHLGGAAFGALWFALKR